jgi:hypothetical protein
MDDFGTPGQGVKEGMNDWLRGRRRGAGLECTGLDWGICKGVCQWLDVDCPGGEGKGGIGFFRWELGERVMEVESVELRYNNLFLSFDISSSAGHESESESERYRGRCFG